MQKLLLIGLILLVGVLPTLGDEALPASPWYAIVHQPETDTLHWYNMAGEQASIPRPTLPDEAQYLDMRIAPNGQTMVMVSQLNNGFQALGIYDFSSGMFIQVHQAQAGESINLGGENIFTANSQYLAVGLFSGDFANPAWRVILFEAQTGNSVAFIDQTHPDAPEVQFSAPAVQYIDATSVHFQLIPQSVGGWHTYPAYAWQALGFNPALPAISESPYTRAGVQVLPLTGEVAITYTDEAYAIAPQNGQTPNFNAVGAGVIANGGAVGTIHADGTRYHLSTRWAKGGDWILFFSTDSLQNDYWNIVLADGTPGNNSAMPFDPQYEAVYGTSDGYLLVNNTDNLFYTNGFLPNTALNIAQLTPLSKVVYVTPIGINFALNSLGGEQNDQIATPSPPPTAAVPVDCSLAPAQRVSIGQSARVLPSMGGLNLRQNPNGAIIMTLNGGDTFEVIGGAICDEGLYWWQINRFGTIGWVAEGLSTGYFIEPYVAPPVEPTDTPAPPPSGPGGLTLVTPKPTVGVFVFVTPVPTIGGIVTPSGD